jgi:hypothetical protein
MFTQVHASIGFAEFEEFTRLLIHNEFGVSVTCEPAFYILRVSEIMPFDTTVNPTDCSKKLRYEFLS